MKTNRVTANPPGAERALEELEKLLPLARAVYTKWRRDHPGEREPRHRLECEWCYDLFFSIRDDAKFCSNKCRQAAYRARKGVGRKLGFS